MNFNALKSPFSISYDVYTLYQVATDFDGDADVQCITVLGVQPGPSTPQPTNLQVPGQVVANHGGDVDVQCLARGLLRHPTII